MRKIPFITGHRTFDRQSEASFFTGNAITNTQLSFFVRPVNETECNGFKNAPGVLFKHDIDGFGPDVDQRVVSFVRGLKKKVVVYQLRHWTGARSSQKKIIHGYIVTDTKDRVLQIFKRCRHPKSHDIIDAAIDQIQAKK